MVSMSPARLLLGTAVPVLALCAASAQAVPARSPAQVAFTRFKSSVYPEIWTASGRGRRRLIRVRNAGADEPAWSPSGRSIAFTVDRNPPEGPRIVDGRRLAYASYTGISTVVVSTGQTRTMVPSRGADLSSPAWRP